MRPIPLFDTNIFSDVQEGKISAEEWHRLLRLRPRKGWPLSAITVLELLAGVHGLPPEMFGQSKKQLEIARELSKGRVLDEPRVLLCQRILHRSFPYGPIPTKVLTTLMEIACRAISKPDLLERRVQYKRSVYRGTRLAGIDTELINNFMAGPKREWVKQIETQLSDIYPNWREHFTQTGLRLPAQVRDRLESPEVWELSQQKFTESILGWLGADVGGPKPSEFSHRIDAVLRFTFWVVRESLLRRYAYDKHESDVYDQIQLHYLADEKYVFVTNDQKLRSRIAGSTQANRIQHFDQFLKLSESQK